MDGLCHHTLCAGTAAEPLECPGRAMRPGHFVLYVEHVSALGDTSLRSIRMADLRKRYREWTRMFLMV